MGGYNSKRFNALPLKQIGCRVFGFLLIGGQTNRLIQKNPCGNMSHLRRRLLLYCLSVALTVSSWGILAVSAVNNIMGGRSEIGLFIGIGMLVGGSMVLGLVNTNWLRALLIGIISPLFALLISGVFSIIVSTINNLLPFVYINSSTTLASVDFTTLLGITELLTCGSFKIQVLPVLKSIGSLFLVILIIEFGRNAIANTHVVVEQSDWLITIIYMLITGINFSILQEMDQLRIKYSSTTIMIGLFIINLLALLIAAAVTRLA